jgi:hypothetical protein
MGSKHNPPRWWKDYEEECRVYIFLSSAYARQVWSGQVVFNAAAAAKLRFMPIADPPPVLTEQEKIDQDVILLGVGFGMLQDDGTIKHMPATKMRVYPRDLITLKVKI